MRRSKQNPAKVQRNYRKISQRRMTAVEDGDEEKEMDRLKELLRTSQKHIDQAVEERRQWQTNGGEGTLEGLASGNKRKRKKKKKKEEEGVSHDRKAASDREQIGTDTDQEESILSKEMQAEMAAMGGGEALILPPRKKKVGKTTPRVELTAEEIKAAKARHKNATRKLRQLADRIEQKKRRVDLYATLRENAISNEEMSLLASSSELGKRVTKKEHLQRLLRRERAGIQLTEEERDVLYTKVKDTTFNEDRGGSVLKTNDMVKGKSKKTQSPENKKKKKDDKVPIEKMEKASFIGEETKPRARETADERKLLDEKCASIRTFVAERDGGEAKEVEISDSTPTAASFAAMMMSGLSDLRTTAIEKKKELDIKAAREAGVAEQERLRHEEEERKNRKVYIPSESIQVKTAASLGLEPKTSKRNWRVLDVNRPDNLETSRYNLPVSAMEYEIVDAVRSNDTTVICAETGSGKSTQVVQMLFEAGLTLGKAKDEGGDEGLLIGVTQPRRVAAVSTAKRVCYEMGHSRDKGQSIRGKRGEGNLVAYQTRYETAGLGSKTRVKFMTDGILLQEIQNDLLLRKYGAIILDEAHERNLNTDVLIGLLSTAIPLRRKAAEEGSLPPLKLVIMSATLRVEDFAGNSRLFPNNDPNIVRIPGRTHPVTIHHSKVTELDDYMSVTFRKVCKIHHKLPPGGILVFLTGKQEIVRMVNLLTKALVRKKDQGQHPIDTNDVSVSNSQGDKKEDILNAGTLRDMDDEEIDGELFENGLRDDYEDTSEDFFDDDGDDPTENRDGQDRPDKVMILPLYSLLSVQDQAKVFQPIPEETRLIVVATNIAETSLTIPDISYVVDSGRQKCRNYHSGTGVTSYDVMWISKAAADQRAGRAGRTSEGHCYRIYSSSLYTRHMDQFALPEILTRPLEDVVLSMKAMKIDNVAAFPFPTAPNKQQIISATKLLSRIGCVDNSRVEELGGDGKITRLGAAVAKLPLGVRYGKMLLVAAQAGVLDYGIIVVAVLSESSPFKSQADHFEDYAASSNINLEGFDEVDRNAVLKEKRKERKERRKAKWTHKGGDILASVLAVGAYTYAGRGSTGASEAAACKKFCCDNGLNYVIMQRIQQMRRHLARLAMTRLGVAEGTAAKTGGILTSMPPPNKFQESLLVQAITSGLLDNIARRPPPGSILGEGLAKSRAAFFSCSHAMDEPLFIDQNSVLYSKDIHVLPEWVCFDSVERKSTRDGSSITVMRNVTPVDSFWLGALASGSNLVSVGCPLEAPPPSYDKENDAVLCSVSTKFGDHGWLIPPRQVVMYDVVTSSNSKGTAFLADSSFRWFGRFLLEGKVLEELQELKSMLNDDPTIITRRKPVSKVELLVLSLAGAGIDSAAALRKHWAEVDDKFLLKEIKNWVQRDRSRSAKAIWVNLVKANVKKWQELN